MFISKYKCNEVLQMNI